MPFRPPLDVSGYIDALGDSRALGGRIKPPPPELVAQQQERQRQWDNTPHKVGYGPAYASSCTTLAVSPEIIWDVNGYYRMLGFSAPYKGITKADLRLAYHAQGGEDSVMLTRVFQLLIDSEKRHAYNCAPFGEQFLDEVQQQLLKDEAYREAARRSRDEGHTVSKDQVLDDWGLVFIPDEDPGAEDVGAIGHDLVDPFEDDFQLWAWGYYQWGSHCTATARLAQWQGFLAAELSRQGVHMRFAVGFSGRRRTDSEWVTAVIGPHLAFFIREDVEPTDGHAAAAVASVLAEHTDENVRKANSTMADTAKPKFGRGGAAAKEEAKKAFVRQKTNFLSIDDGEKIILRFIDDSPDWIYVKQHFAPTKPAPSDAPDELKKNWPKRTGAVCRHDEAFAGMYEDCYICDTLKGDNPRDTRSFLRIWARAVVRKEIIGTQEMVDEGKIEQEDVDTVVGMQDELIEVPEFKNGKPTGKNIKQRNVILVNQGMKNFFAALQAAYDVYKTVLDRDFVVTREGSGTDTEYGIIALEPILMSDGKTKYSMKDPKLAARYEGIVDMEKEISDRASDEHYARYFDPTKTVKFKKNKDSDDEASEVAQADEEEYASAQPERPKPNADAIAAMRDKVRKKSGPKQEEEPEDKPEPEVDEEADEAPRTKAMVDFSS